ncbi:RNA-binding family protein isoform 1 [Dorcoceras hygrometricum]|uniref:RNA-binding family protein isoform 1 n=1 Tax=Dorcoceras hygrometricum TaxID=472368 RepID=A0A2Z7CDM4_9LAMI|nr:RNA-binding family protein isoform 1 [Dorcoceras hygrometricum]
MEDSKKRKHEEIGNGKMLPNLNETATSSTVEELRALLDPLAKPQLVDLLSKAGSQYPSIAEDIRSVASADPALRKLFVRGLAWNTSSETLCAAFQEHGEIEEGAVIHDKATGKSRGYGFITYKDMESAQRALRAPGKMIDGRMAACNLASEGLNSSSSTLDQAQRKLYVGGLSPETSSEMLLSYFRRHGEIEEGSVAYDKDSNKSRGFGFVTYKTVEAAKKAVDDPQKILGGRNITVKLADNYKGKVIPAGMIPVPVHMTAGYPQKAYSETGTPIGYSYPQPMASFGSYTSPSSAAPYSAQPQYSYPQFGARKDTSPSPTAYGGYPYYMPKQ